MRFMGAAVSFKKPSSCFQLGDIGTGHQSHSKTPQVPSSLSNIRTT